ncbi:hypothetical protein [Burkholderia sp. BCC1208]|uniref:hypothetical protein n=1 Tax=Burkholderia sp. BCC1208 TaxID=2676292 RepID=UPI0012BC0FBC|nr:hypothetical protein [Burkholderia sp. BCC1208]
MNPLHGGAIVRAARLGRRLRAAVSHPPARGREGQRTMLHRTTSRERDLRPGSFHDKRSNLPVTYAAWPFRAPGGAASSQLYAVTTATLQS